MSLHFYLFDTMDFTPFYFDSFGCINIVNISVKGDREKFLSVIWHSLEHRCNPFEYIPKVVFNVLMFNTSNVEIEATFLYMFRTVLGPTNNNYLMNLLLRVLLVFFDTVIRINNSTFIEGLYCDLIDLEDSTVTLFVNVTGLITRSACNRCTILSANHINR